MIIRSCSMASAGQRSAATLKRWSRAAHKLKGSVANFAAPIAYDAALRLEVMGRNGHLDDAPEALEELESALEDLRPLSLNLGGGLKP